MNETTGRLLAVGNVAEVFEWGARVVKLYKSTAAKPAAFREAAIHAAVEAMALPVPKVWSVQEIGGRWGVVFDRAKQASFAEQMLSNSGEVPRYLKCMVRLHMRTHSHPGIQFADLKVRLADNIAVTSLLDERRKRDLLDRIAHMPDGDRLCHGDFHPMNILGRRFAARHHRLARRASWRSCRRCLPFLPVDEITCCRNCDDLSRHLLPNSRYVASSRAQLVAVYGSCQACRRRSTRTRWLAENCRHVLA